MFYLKIQSTKHPAYQLVIHSKITCSTQLMNSPFRVDFSMFAMTVFKFNILNNVSQLKYKTHKQTKYKMHNCKSQKCPSKTINHCWNSNIESEVNDFSCPEHYMV